MTITTDRQAPTKDDTVPRKVLITAWAVPVLVLGQFAFVAALPVGIIVVTVLRRLRTGAIRWWAIALGAVFATPMAIWALRPDRAPSLSKDMSPIFMALIVAAAGGLIVSAYRSRSR